MKKLLSIVAITGLLVTGAMASNTKVGIYGGYGAGSYTVENNDNTNNMHSYEGGIFIDNINGHFYNGIQIGYAKYNYANGNVTPTAIMLRGKAGVHFDGKFPINIYGLLAGGYGSGDDEGYNYDYITFGGGIGVGVNFTKHWGIEINYLHTTDNFIYTDYPDEYNAYDAIQRTTNRGEVFIKYSF